MLFWKYIYIKRKQIFSAFLLPYLVIPSLLNPLGSKQRHQRSAARPADALLLICVCSLSHSLVCPKCIGAVRPLPAPAWTCRLGTCSTWAPELKTRVLPGAGDSSAAQGLLPALFSFPGAQKIMCICTPKFSPPSSQPPRWPEHPIRNGERPAASQSDSSHQEEDIKTKRGLCWRGNSNSCWCGKIWRGLADKIKTQSGLMSTSIFPFCQNIDTSPAALAAQGSLTQSIFRRKPANNWTTSIFFSLSFVLFLLGIVLKIFLN